MKMLLSLFPDPTATIRTFHSAFAVFHSYANVGLEMNREYDEIH